MATSQQSSCTHTTNASTNRICEIVVRGLLAGLLVSMFGLAACSARARQDTNISNSVDWNITAGCDAARYSPNAIGFTDS
jgi:hypothetical protein